MERKITFIADITQDIDDIIAIEYLHSVGMLDCVVLDGHSVDAKRTDALVEMGVNIENEIPSDTKIIFCGGAYTKISEFIKTNTIDLLVGNGGFAGTNVVTKTNELTKFKNKLSVRTYNFNLDVSAVLNVLTSPNIKERVFVSKNVCHNKINTISGIHSDEFLIKYNLRHNKRLHDLLMVKEGISILNKNETICDYLNVELVCDIKEIENMSLWGCQYDKGSNTKISVSY